MPRVGVTLPRSTVGAKRIDYPPAAQTNVTFKTAPKAKAAVQQPTLPALG